MQGMNKPTHGDHGLDEPVPDSVDGAPPAVPVTFNTSPPVSPPPPRRKGRWWACCLVFFVVLCLLAVLGNYLSRNSGLIPKLPKLPPDIIPTVPAPQPTPHALPKTVEGVTRTLEPVMRDRFGAACDSRLIKWPPQRVRLVGLKAERKLELWAANMDGPFHLLKTYPVLAASGELGPKRRQGDKQVPEGHYRVVYLNADSKYHLSMLLDYPNSADQARESAALDDGENLGGDICVHGSNRSIGCLAVGDTAIEEIFTMTALARPGHRDILIFPADFRKRPDLLSLAGDDADLVKLYSDLAKLAETVSIEQPSQLTRN